jgi:7-cyano-7-deazaguanine tRNA-ribosyltransferase
LETLHGILETPAFVPVVHPVRQTISPQFLKEMGFNALITNAYITFQQYGDRARKQGIHNIIGFDGIVMTDSGGYQVIEYGSVDIEPAIMAQYEIDIKSDIPVPLDKPTGFGLEFNRAKEYVLETLSNAKETLEIVSAGAATATTSTSTRTATAVGQSDEQIWVGPIQGAEHSDLVRFSAESLDRMGFKLMALGSPVEVMEAYEFAILAKMIAAAKRAVPAKPIHLFGAGHPLTIPLAISLGCDMFDSASYMLYAKDNRYMHSNGTSRLQEMTYLPCQCPICTNYQSGKALLEIPHDKRTIELAKHNLYAIRAEVETVKQSIMDGRLWEYVVQKARGHPKLMEAISMFGDFEFEFLEFGTSLFKEKAVFLFDPLDQYRPEARRFRKITSRFRRVRSSSLILCRE